MHEIKRTHKLASGGSVTVKVRTEDPVKEEEFPILSKGAAAAMAEVLVDIANYMRPLGSKEVRLGAESK